MWVLSSLSSYNLYQVDSSTLHKTLQRSASPSRIKPKFLQKRTSSWQACPPLPRSHFLLLSCSFPTSYSVCLHLPLQAKLTYTWRPLHLPLPPPRTPSCPEHPLYLHLLQVWVHVLLLQEASPPPHPVFHFLPSPDFFFFLALAITHNLRFTYFSLLSSSPLHWDINYMMAGV